MPHFSWESISTMLSVLFATEACSTIKENTNKKSFCRGKLPFCRRKLPFHWRKLRKAYFASKFLAEAKTVVLQGLEKNFRMKEKYKKS